LAVERALPRHDLGHGLIDRCLGVARRRAGGGMFRIAVRVAAGPAVAGARLLLAIWAAAARRQRFVVLLAIAAAPIRLRSALFVPTLVAKTLSPSLGRLAIGVARRRPLNVLVVGRLDHAVEPFTDRPARSARNRARNLVCFRTTSSELPRRARFHSRSTHIVKSRMCTLFRADGR